MRVLVLTRYGHKGASSRVRIIQFERMLASQGIDLEISPLLSDHYIDTLYSSKKRSIREVVKSCLKRFLKLLSTREYDLIWIEKELIPFLPFCFEKFLFPPSTPVVLDFDDATFHAYDNHANWLIRKFLGQKIDGLMRKGTLVIAGNDYIANRAKKAGANVAVLPDAIDPTAYQDVPPKKAGEPFTVVWIGTPITVVYLNFLMPVFEQILGDNGRLNVIGATLPPASWIRSFDWSVETEAELLGACDVGVMPLTNAPWERGKCGYKILQYFAAGIPVIASPVGVNVDIIEESHGGLTASTQSEWYEALMKLKTTQLLRHEMGEAGRAWAYKHRSKTVIGSELARFLASTATIHDDEAEHNV